jgi:hypothetical protein
LLSDYPDDRDLQDAILGQVVCIVESLRGMARANPGDARFGRCARSILNLARKLKGLNRHHAAFRQCDWELDSVAFSQPPKIRLLVLRSALFDYVDMHEHVDAVEFLDLLALRLKKNDAA